jgi:hypothetical protein
LKRKTEIFSGIIIRSICIRTKDSSPERRRDCAEFYGGPGMKIYFARHGQTDWNIQRKVQGTTDIPLNENGIRQAQELCKNLEDRKISFEKI